MTLRLGLMGGAFDPIHHGHLFIAEAARAHFCLDRVLFIPTGRPPHKRRLNEATMEVYGIKRANVENYFPLSVNKDFLNFLKMS